MQIRHDTAPYNARRYGRPYIARLNGQGEPIWGTWIGANGESGRLEIEAPLGAAIMIGQRDHRGRNSRPDYYTVQADGSLAPVPTRLAAIDAARALEAVQS